MMEPLIDIDPQPLNSISGENNAKPSVDLLDDCSNGEAALLSCPVLVAEVDGRPATRVLPGALGPSVAPTVDTANHVPKAVQPNATAIIPEVQLTHAEIVTRPGPGPLSLPKVDPIGAIREAARTTHTSGRGSQRAQANFIISHIPDVASGVVEAVYKELAQAEGCYKFELRQAGQGSYLRITAPAKNIPELVCAAQDAADELISDEAVRVSGIYQEPPARVNPSSRVVLVTEPGQVRPRLQLGQGADTMLELPESFQEYATKLNDRVYRGLKKAGRLPLALTLRVQLGYCMLRSYPQGREVYEYRDFHAMIKNPRASAWLKTSIGNEFIARRVLDFVRNDVRSPFLPTTNQVTSSADVLPEYAFEAHSQLAKFNAPIIDKSRRGRGNAAYQLSSVTASGTDSNFTDLDIVSLSVGKNLDWKLEATNEERDTKAFPNIIRYLERAKVDLRGLDRPHNFDVYPRVKLPTNNPVAASLKDVAVKTVYRFKWRTTPYVVQITVNHRWESISAMCAEKMPTIDLGVSIFGEDWDSEDDVAGIVWGDELQYLLEGGNGGTAPKGIDRVANFLQTIRDIRNVLEPFF
ncbi:hypothetical protein F5Y06DRAFT_303563 [Hypoxylon sp. FL0890]|nr:hypothetical protein F5Y06DRAFT_303563 [Hypoxylon sp. FL0890]